jgi:hypothetical protein
MEIFHLIACLSCKYQMQVMFSKPLPDFSCRLNAFATAVTCQWLMGPCKVNDVELDDGRVSNGWWMIRYRAVQTVQLSLQYSGGICSSPVHAHEPQAQFAAWSASQSGLQTVVDTARISSEAVVEQLSKLAVRHCQLQRSLLVVLSSLLDTQAHAAVFNNHTRQ